MAIYNIVPASAGCYGTVEAETEEDALLAFTDQMDSDMHAYFRAVAEKPEPAKKETQGAEPEILPDGTVGLSEMYAYGYSWDGMLPLREIRAMDLFHAGVAVHRLYPDGSETLIEDAAALEGHDGLFGVEKNDWDVYLEKLLKQRQETIMKYYEILFRDSYGICIKSEVTPPSKEQVAKFMHKDFEKFGYTIEDIESIDEISLEEAKSFYDMEEEWKFPILR